MENNDIPQWRELLKSAIKREGNIPSSRWVQLATTNLNNEPRVRTVVFREWIGSNSMIIFTDGRSQKTKEININNNVEILWLFLRSKSQFRFRGKAEFIDNNDNYWKKLSNKSKEQWYWPHPGKKLERQSSKQMFNISNKPSNFLVIRVNIESTELLELTVPNHKRYSWEKNQNWSQIELNP